MKLKFTFIAILIACCYTNASCLPHNQSLTALETLNLIANDSNGFNGIPEVPNSPNISQGNTSLKISKPELVMYDSANEKGATNGYSLAILKEFGTKPDANEVDSIEKALAILNSTKIGREVCKSTLLDGCTWKDFTAAKIEITTRDLKYHLPEPLESMVGFIFGSKDPEAAVPPPSKINGRTIICLHKGLVSGKSPAEIATYILHELSHVADNRILGERSTGTTQLSSEYKSVTIQMMIRDELLRTGQLKSDPTNGVQFILSIYRWKNGGPKPNTDYSTTVEGKHYTAKEIIGSKLEPDDTGLKAILHITKYFYSIPEGTLTERDVRYWQGIRGAIKKLEPKYQAWFPSKPPVVVTPPTPQPPVTPPQPPVTPSQPPTPPNHPSNNNGNEDSDDDSHSNGGGASPHDPPPVNGGGSDGGGVDWHDGSHWGEN